MTCIRNYCIFTGAYASSDEEGIYYVCDFFARGIVFCGNYDSFVKGVGQFILRNCRAEVGFVELGKGNRAGGVLTLYGGNYTYVVFVERL